jgi:hypothetical protein
MKIDFPRDIHSEEDRYAYCALPTHVRRLLVRDLLAFIASLKVESFAAEDASNIAMIGCAGAAQSLLERRAVEVPMPTLSLRAEIYSQTVPLLEKVHVVAIHSEPCLLCSTHDGHCDYWQVTFPNGTDFGKATQTESDRLQHIYSFTPILPNSLSNRLRIYLDYYGIWEPDRPWKLTALNPSMD